MERAEQRCWCCFVVYFDFESIEINVKIVAKWVNCVSVGLVDLERDFFAT